MRCWLGSLMVVATATGCAGLDRNIEDQVTIEQGVYGLLIAGCDSDGCHDHPAANADVVVYVPGNDDVAGTSNGDGVYQFSLPPGDYTICTYSCVPVTVPSGTIRYDWTSGPGGGHWEPQE